MSEDLADFIRARLDEDERVALAAAQKVSVAPNDGRRWSRDWDTVHTAPSEPPGPRQKVADCGHGGWGLTEHVARHDPARVLAEVAAKRRMIDEYALTVQIRDEAAERIRAAGDAPDAMDLDTWHRAQREAAILDDWVRLLAVPYADQPGYRPEWAPDA